MIQVVEIVDPKDDKESVGLSIENMVQKDDSTPVTAITTKKKRGPGRPPKNGSPIMYTDIVTDDANNATKKKDSFEKKMETGYAPQAALLYGTINQTDILYSSIDEELQKYKDNRNYGGKTRAMNMSSLLSSQVGVINAKTNIVRELNNIRSRINDAVMKNNQMMKDTKEDNADKAVMDAYYALVNAPQYGLNPNISPLSQSSINTGINLSGNVIPTSTLSTGIVTTDATTPQQVSTPAGDASFQNYLSNLTPIQQRMILEKDPNVKTVVVYNQSTGHKYFDIVNVATGQSIPGAQRPAEFLLDDMRIDFRTGTASNSNANMSFPLVVTGNRAIDEL